MLPVAVTLAGGGPSRRSREVPKNIFFRLDLTELYEMVYVRLEEPPMLASLPSLLTDRGIW